jgi:flagellar FliL protein
MVKEAKVTAKTEAADEAAATAKPKSKKLMIIIIIVVLLLAVAGGGAFYFFKKRAAAAEEDGADPAAVAHVAPKGPPAYLPLDNMVVNLADPGGEKVAQVGVTLEVADAHASDTVKAYLPTIRSGILMLISQRTAEELLKPEGKEKLKMDILHEASLPFVGEGAPEGAAPAKAAKAAAGDHAQSPIQGVLFSSFIVQ